MEKVVCKCLETLEIQDSTVCSNCSEEVLTTSDIKKKMKEISNQVSNLSHEWSMLNTEIWLRTSRNPQPYIIPDPSPTKLTRKQINMAEIKTLLEMVSAE